MQFIFALTNKFPRCSDAERVFQIKEIRFGANNPQEFPAMQFFSQSTYIAYTSPKLHTKAKPNAQFYRSI